jgi:hypothetical protein
MSDQRTNEIAFEAARLLDDGAVEEISAAVRAAVDQLGHHDAPRPSEGRIRKHLQALSMSAVGAEAYGEDVKRILATVEQIMALVDLLFDDVESMLVGRGALGLVDGPTALHVRLYTRRPLRDIATVLVAHGYTDPAFETADTRLGRMDRMRLEDDGVEVILTRCMPEHRATSDRDLFKDGPIATIDLDGLRAQLD